MPTIGSYRDQQFYKQQMMEQFGLASSAFDRIGSMNNRLAYLERQKSISQRNFLEELDMDHIPMSQVVGSDSWARQRTATRLALYGVDRFPGYPQRPAYGPGCGRPMPQFDCFQGAYQGAQFASPMPSVYDARGSFGTSSRRALGYSQMPVANGNDDWYQALRGQAMRSNEGRFWMNGMQYVYVDNGRQGFSRDIERPWLDEGGLFRASDDPYRGNLVLHSFDPRDREPYELIQTRNKYGTARVEGIKPTRPVLHKVQFGEGHKPQTISINGTPYDLSNLTYTDERGNIRYNVRLLSELYNAHGINVKFSGYQVIGLDIRNPGEYEVEVIKADDESVVKQTFSVDPREDYAQRR